MVGAADEEEILFAIGFGGALIAPFVMSTGVPRYVVLAIYGLVLIGAGMRTIAIARGSAPRGSCSAVRSSTR